MDLLNDARRWLKDHASHDEYIDGTPKEHLRLALESFPGMSHNERQHSLGHVTAYSEYYHRHHGEVVPADMRQQLNAARNTVEQLRALDHAREVLQSYGGPPSRQTIAESLERSERERQAQQEKQAERPAHRQKPEQRQEQRQSVRESVSQRVGG